MYPFFSRHSAKDCTSADAGPSKVGFAAALVVAAKARDLADGVALAQHSIDSGAAEGRLDRLITVSNA